MKKEVSIMATSLQLSSEWLYVSVWLVASSLPELMEPPSTGVRLIDKFFMYNDEETRNATWARGGYMWGRILQKATDKYCAPQNGEALEG